MTPVTRRDFIKAGIGAVAGLAGIGGPLIAEGRGPRSGTNLLFIMTDQQRWDALGRAGNKILKTPNLDRLAREGAYFERAFTACPVCVPARTSILTGCSVETTGVRRNEEITRKGYAQMPTFDNILSDRGVWAEYYGKWHAPIWRALDYKNPSDMYHTFDAHYGKYLDDHVPKREPREGEQIDILYSRRPYKPDPLDARYGLRPGEQPLDEGGKPIRFGQPDCLGCLDVPAQHTASAVCANETIEAIERLKDRAFSITCSFHHPHPPFTPSKPYCGMYPPAEMPLPASIDDPMSNSPYRDAGLYKNVRTFPKELFRYMISDYYGLVHEIDHHVGCILSKLKELGLDKNTLVIFTSDHGEMLGAHNKHGKNVFYEESAHIPLIMRLPGVIPANAVVKEPVSHLDLFATILDYLNVPGHSSQGRSLRGLTKGKDRASFEYVVSEWGGQRGVDDVPNFMVRTKDWKLLFCRTEDPNRLDGLYNLKDDPHEMNNLVGDNPDRGKWLRQAEEMKERLIEWLGKVGSPFLDAVKRRPIH